MVLSCRAVPRFPHHGRLGRMRISFPAARAQSELQYCRRSTLAAFEFGLGPSDTLACAFEVLIDFERRDTEQSYLEYPFHVH